MFDLPSLDIPAIAELAQYEQWVAWRYIERGGKRTKMPVNPKTGKAADTTASHTWGTFQQACDCLMSRPGMEGVGFVFAESDPFSGVDIDGCYSKQGALANFAEAIVHRFASYTEVTPSGRGLHILVRGRYAGTRNRKGKIECYTTGRFFTITGKSLDEQPDSIEDGEDSLGWLSGTYLKADAPAGSAGASEGAEGFSKLEKEIAPSVTDAAAPAPARLDTILGNAPMLLATWLRMRRLADDVSASAWDQSLANQLTVAGLQPAEITSWLIAHRRDHGESLKLRIDYYARTINRAMADLEFVLEGQRLLGDEPPKKEETKTEGEEQPDPETPDAKLETIRSIFRIGIERVIIYPGDPTRYRLVCERGEYIGGPEIFISQSQFRRAILVAARRTDIRRLTTKQFDKAMQLLLDVAEIHDTGKGATETGEIEDILMQYVSSKARAKQTFDKDAIREGGLFTDDASLWIVGPDFTSYVAMMIKRSPAKVCQLLRQMGCTHKAYSVKLPGGGRTTKQCWRLPHSLITPQEIAEQQKGEMEDVQTA